MDDKRDDSALSGLGDIIRGVGKLVGSAINIADKDSFKKSFSGDLFKGKNVDSLKGKYDFSVKLGLNKEDGMGTSSQRTQYTPQAEVFNEKDQLVVILELPGVDKDSLQFDVDENTLVINAEGKDVSYQKEINLGDFPVSRDGISISENNGIFKLTIKADDGGKLEIKSGD
jgi:HSP20 family protein